ncbi:MAG: FAD-binding oxidoreductase [Desulfurococcales archaeon]|nr:FAD-binding oxidoreductase [Desulfurococcales archaeon]
MCRLRELEAMAHDMGVEARWLQGRVEPGDRWWEPPLDAWPLLDLALYVGLTRKEALILRPSSVEEVANIVRAAGDLGVCLIARGGGSGVLGAAAPRGCCAVLDLSRLNNIRVDPENHVVHAGAGALLWDVEEEAGKHGLTTGLEPQSIRVASVGGLVSTLGVGALQPGYGNIEDALLYVDIVAPVHGPVRLGSPLRPRGLTPYGLEHLPLGVEGGLGVIVSVGLRLRGKPKHVESASFRFPDLASALRAARRLVQWNQPALLRVLDERESLALHGAEGPLLIVAYYDDEDSETLGALMGKAVKIASKEGGVEERDVYWEWRERRYNYGELVKAVASAGMWFDTIDLQAPWSTLPELHDKVIQALDNTPGVQMSYSHISHFYPNGGSLYVTIAVEAEPGALARAWSNALRVARGLGSVTHHHGVGLQKLYWYTAENRDALKLYCSVKRALDPRNTLNPHGPSSHCRVHGLG